MSSSDEIVEKLLNGVTRLNHRCFVASLLFARAGVATKPSETTGSSETSEWLMTRAWRPSGRRCIRLVCRRRFVLSQMQLSDQCATFSCTCLCGCNCDKTCEDDLFFRRHMYETLDNGKPVTQNDQVVEDMYAIDWNKKTWGTSYLIHSGVYLL